MRSTLPWSNFARNQRIIRCKFSACASDVFCGLFGVLVLCALSFESFAIELRIYRKGWHIDRSNADKKKTTHNNRIRVIAICVRISFMLQISVYGIFVSRRFSRSFCVCFALLVPQCWLALFIDTKIYIWKSNSDLYFLLCLRMANANEHFICVARTFYPLVHKRHQRHQQRRQWQRQWQRQRQQQQWTSNWNNENSPCRFVIIRHCSRSK